MHQDETQYSLSCCSARECLYYLVSVECFFEVMLQIYFIICECSCTFSL